MRQLATYAFTNAKVRAMLSYLISPAEFTRLLEAKTIYEAIDILKSTRYSDVFEDIEAQALDLAALEKKLALKDLAIYRKVYDSISRRREKEFVALLAQRYEIDDIKVALRLWHSKEQRTADDYILGGKVTSEIDFGKIISAETIEEIIILLDKTVYKESLLRARDKFKSTKSLFYPEAALDVDYYNRLIDCVMKFSPTDKRTAQRILGVEIDSENIQWLIKLRKYYSLGLGEMLDWFIPGGSRISKNTLRGIYTSDGISKVVEGLAFGPYVQIKDLAEENIYLIENFLYEILLKEVRIALAGNPFTIGTVLGYLILKRRETKNIVSILYAKSYGLKGEDITHLLNL